ncbi:MAG: GntR family transcriptional regulator [Anaerolineae bacterium]|nr:GntR family transcriptional regulator [Anaerolineae bacterium]
MSEQVPVPIDRDSPTPLYRQLYNLLRSQIELGELGDGQAIPPEKQLAEIYGVSRVTTRKALHLLAEDKLIIRQPGRGTYVASARFQENLSSLRGFAELMRAQYPDHKMEVLSFETRTANADLRQMLALPDGEQILQIKRRHMLGEQPLAFVVIYLPYDLGSTLTVHEASTTPIYTLLMQKSGVVISRAVQTVSAVVASHEVAGQLHVPPDSPVLLVRRVTYSAQDQPLEYIHLYYPGGRHELIMELHRDSIRMHTDHTLAAGVS